MQNNKNIISNRIRISVGNQVFEIPSEKVGELMMLLSKWQALGVSENVNNPNDPKWLGRNLIFG